MMVGEEREAKRKIREKRIDSQKGLRTYWLSRARLQTLIIPGGIG